ncbi:flagellar biosynthetic protein FliO [Roseibium album]|nr:flagellar biosynthetic protein FliO [Roseibium album]
MYNWIETTFNVSGGVTQTIAVILALLVVLLLFSLFIFILKRLMGANAPQSRSRQPRIAVMDSATVDTKRRLVLIRRDNVEHLLLVGGPSDVVVEQHIVRNAPLTSGRPVTQMTTGQIATAQTATGQPGPAPIKAPMAPGPDIPARPDETHMPTETLSPVALAAQTAPTPVFPATDDISAKITPTPKPVAADPTPVKAPPLVTEPPVNPFAKDKADFQPDTKESPNRAADLLRAATQNGFNRKRSQQVKPETAPEFSATNQSEPPSSAPVIKPEPAAVKETAPAPTGKTASTFKSLTRPFASRERPSYGNHSITPPASGPAARAKTALLTPVEGSKDAKKTEPIIDTPEPRFSEPDAGALAPKENHHAEPAAATVEPTGSNNSDFDLTTKTSNEETPSADVVSRDPDEENNNASRSSQEQTDLSSTSLSEAEPDATGSPKELNLDLEVESLIFDEASPQENPAVTEADASNTGAPQSEIQVSVEATPDTSAHALNAPDIKVPETQATDSKAPEVKTPGKQTKPSTTSLAEKNPIEDEMAKILDELVGQPN